MKRTHYSRVSTETATEEQHTTLQFSLPKRWHLQQKLGEGGQAQVWLAFDRQLDQLVALKVFEGDLSAAEVVRLRREVLLGRDLSHPNLVRIYELVEGEGCLAVAMEWVCGGSVKDWLVEGPVDIARVIRVAEASLAALAYLHRRRIIHRDVKPSNLLVAADGTIKLGDFGLLRRLEGLRDVTVTVAAVGSRPYMSPEQLLGRPLSPATDLFSLGVTLYELLTGAPPENDSALGSWPSGAASKPLDPRKVRPDCPRWLAHFVSRLLEPNPKDRFPCAEAALHAFNCRRAPVSPRVWRRLGAGFAATAVLALAVGLGVDWNKSKREKLLVLSEGNKVRALDQRGRLLWEQSFASGVRQVEQADLDGDGKEEVLVATFADIGLIERSAARPPSEVAVVDRRGALVSLFQPEEFLRIHPEHIAPPLLMPKMELLDVNADGTVDLVVNCRHRSLGTAYLFAYNPQTNSWPVLLMHEGGWIFNLAAVPGGNFPRVRFFAVNGIIGTLGVVGELEFDLRRALTGFELREPQLGIGTPPWSRLAWYTPVGEVTPVAVDASPGFFVREDGTSSFKVRQRVFAVDSFGNPLPGLNAGRNLASLRTRFLEVLDSLITRRVMSGTPEGQQMVRAIEEEFAPLLAEEPEQAVFALSTARGLAVAGFYNQAIKGLGGAFERLGYEGLGLGLAHLQAISGDLMAAKTTLLKLMAKTETPAGWFRAPQLLGRVGIEARDTGAIQAMLTAGVFRENLTPEVLAAITARARLWWDQAEESDLELRSSDLTPDGEAIACLARWRLGRVAPEDPERMFDAIARNPDAEGEGRIARAMALSALGRHEQALQELAVADRHVSRKSSFDFLYAQVKQLLVACTAKALLAAGRRGEARTLAERWKPSLRPGLLPYVLVEEVLQAAGKEKDQVAKDVSLRR